MASGTDHVAITVSSSVHALLNVASFDLWFEKMGHCLPSDVHKSVRCKTRLAAPREVCMRQQVELGRDVLLWVFPNPYQLPYAVLKYSREGPASSRKRSVDAVYAAVEIGHRVACQAYLVQGTAAAKACSKERILRAMLPADSSALNIWDHPQMLPSTAARHLAGKLKLLPAYKVGRHLLYADLLRRYKLPAL